MRVRLYELFVQIEREFEILYAENLSLQEKVDSLTNAAASTASIGGQTPSQNHTVVTAENFMTQTTNVTNLTSLQQPLQHNNNVSGSMSVPVTPASVSAAAASTPLGLGLGLSSNKMSRALYAHKLRTHTNKLKQHTNKIMSNFKGKAFTLFCLVFGQFFDNQIKFGPKLQRIAEIDSHLKVFVKSLKIMYSNFTISKNFETNSSANQWSLRILSSSLKYQT